MAQRLRIPPVFVEADPNPPPVGARFERRPAKEIAKGDILGMDLGDETMWRVVDRVPYQNSPKILFNLHPIHGGRPTSIVLFPREWKAVYRPQEQSDGKENDPF